MEPQTPIKGAKKERPQRKYKHICHKDIPHTTSYKNTLGHAMANPLMTCGALWGNILTFIIECMGLTYDFPTRGSTVSYYLPTRVCYHQQITIGTYDNKPKTNKFSRVWVASKIRIMQSYHE